MTFGEDGSARPDAEIAGIRFESYDARTLPLGMLFRETLAPWTDQDVVATGIPTHTGPSVSVTTGWDKDEDPPGEDPGGDPPGGVL